MSKRNCGYTKVQNQVRFSGESGVSVFRMLIIIILANAMTCGRAMAELVPIASAGAQPNVARESSNNQLDIERNTGSFPNKLSKLDGWHGVKLVTANRGAYTYCSYEFPARFGVRDSGERKVLLRLIRNDPEIRIDNSGCMVSFDSAYYQLFRLASEYQVADAARWFVMPKGAQALNLDGEWAETYDLKYRPKVLAQFDNLRAIISLGEESILADEICAVVATTPDAYLDGAGINPVIRSLRAKGMRSLAQKLLEGCGRTGNRE